MAAGPVAAQSLQREPAPRVTEPPGAVPAAPGHSAPGERHQTSLKDSKFTNPPVTSARGREPSRERGSSRGAAPSGAKEQPLPCWFVWVFPSVQQKQVPSAKAASSRCLPWFLQAPKRLWRWEAPRRREQLCPAASAGLRRALPPLSDLKPLLFQVEPDLRFSPSLPRADFGDVPFVSHCQRVVHPRGRRCSVPNGSTRPGLGGHSCHGARGDGRSSRCPFHTPVTALTALLSRGERLNSLTRAWACWIRDFHWKSATSLLTMPTLTPGHRLRLAR